MPTDSCVRWCQALNRRCWLDCAMGCNIFPSVPHIAIMQTISKHMQIHPGPHVYQEKVTVDTWWPILVCVVWIRIHVVWIRGQGARGLPPRLQYPAAYLERSSPILWWSPSVLKCCLLTARTVDSLSASWSCGRIASSG